MVTVADPSGTSNNQLHKWAKSIKAALAAAVSAPVTNAQLADMASPTFKARGTAGSGAPENIPPGNGITLDSTSARTAQQMSITVDGSGLKLSGDAASPGNSKYYGTDSGGTKGFFDLPSGGGMTLITSVTTTSGTSISITSLGGYKMLIAGLRAVGHSSAGTRTLRCAVSGNNGSSYGTAFTFHNGSFDGTQNLCGFVFISRTDQSNNQLIDSPEIRAPATSPIETSAIGPIDAIQFTWSSGDTFDNGAIDVYGVK